MSDESAGSGFRFSGNRFNLGNGQDSNSAIATRLIRPKPVFLLTSLGEAEFTNAVELRVFRKEWTRLEARSVHDLFVQHQAGVVFRIAPLGSEIWEKALVLSPQHSAKLGTRRSTFSTLRPHLFWAGVTAMQQPTRLRPDA